MSDKHSGCIDGGQLRLVSIMLKKISLENFKPFGRRQIAELKPITLVYGPNSSGKSSLIQSLLLLAQSITPRNESSNLVPRGELVDLGSFQSLVHRHESDRALRFNFTFTSSERFGPYLRQSENNNEELDLGIALTYLSESDTRSSAHLPARLDEVSYQFGAGGESIGFKCLSSEKVASDFANVEFFGDEASVMCEFLDSSSVSTAADWIRKENPSLERRLTRTFPTEQTDKLKTQQALLQKQTHDLKKELEKLRGKVKDGKLKAVTVEKYKKKIAELRSEEKILKSLSRDLQHRIQFLRDRPDRNAGDDSKGGQGRSLEEIISDAIITSGFMPLPERLLVKDFEKAGSYDTVGPGTFDTFSMGFFYALQSLRYMGPLRSYPERHYLVSGAGVKSVGISGENTPHLLFEHKNTIRNDVNRWLESFSIPYELDINLKGDDEVMGDILTISLKDVNTGIRVSPSDVGFGIGQLLPIIVEGLFSRLNILCVEQPEIHLHPRLQASLADFFIETSENLRNGKAKSSASKRASRARNKHASPRSNQWIVETHSEALMLRLQKRIRDGSVAAKDVSVLYVEPAEEGGRIISLPLDDSGNFIKEWPGGFFEEAFEEMIG